MKTPNQMHCQNNIRIRIYKSEKPHKALLYVVLINLIIFTKNL